MIHVSQGHELGIGLEVFLKSLLYLPQRSLTKITLHANPEALEATLKSITNSYAIQDNSLTFLNKEIRLKNIPKDKSIPQSTSSLLSALEAIKANDVLITLPTSKNQLIINGISPAGYTEFFRNFFKKDDITMVFGGPFGFTALLTDHIPLSEVPKKLSSKLILQKSHVILSGLKRYFHTPTTVVYAGINPHAGEGGVLGKEEEVFTSSLKELESAYPEIKFKGPLPGDTLHFEAANRGEKLFIYSFHDQGLPPFKSENGLFGINISLGLPFLRLSVDHGTAFPLYGKNIADCRGCLYTLQQALRVIDDD